MSYLESKYHKWFKELGYPQLDIQEWDDGEWAILEYIGPTVIPCETKWNYILTGLRHIEPSYGFVKNYIDTQETMTHLFRVKKDLDSLKIAEEKMKEDRRVQDLAERATQLVRRNEAMYQRVAANGLQELNLHNIAKHIPQAQLRHL